MNKRKFKKLLQYEITDAVELVLIKHAQDKNKSEAVQNKELDALLYLYDETFSKVGQDKKLKTTKEKRAHFKTLLENFDKEAEKIYSDK